MSLPDLIATYGYLAVFLGALLEGETVLAMAGFAAHRGYLSLPWVIAVACAGGFIGDQALFWLGRHRGPWVRRRFPAVAAAMPRVEGLLARGTAFWVIGLRFMYGFRVVGPIAMGMTPLHWRSYALFNFLGAVLWAVLIGVGGYVFGHVLEILVADLARYEHFALAGIALLMTLWWLLARLRQRGRSRRLR